MTALAHLPMLSDHARFSSLLWRYALRLIDLLQSTSEWQDDDATIYVAQPWSGDSDAVIIKSAPDTTEPVKHGEISYSYFLEAFIARDFIKDYAASGEGASATESERCERLIRYAEDDA
ncbi:hypothetical protein [Sphingomonas sp.]|uniref:hypothetical protein n=1 Tax=Sphingomonas sp. TaxID=28214 RepID=UPI002EDB08C3